jgi:hypothetical protein
MRISIWMFLLICGSTVPVQAQQPQGCMGAGVTITDIVTNQAIRGQVTDRTIRTGFKVVVYVHTDQWYIHPYVGQGKGLSYALIDPQTGDWTIKTVKRQFVADAVAAAVVPEGQALLGTLTENPPHNPKASCVMQLDGPPFQGRL